MTILLNDPVELCSDALEAYFRKKMGELKNVIQDFPSPNDRLVYPSLTITNAADDGSYTSLQPYEDSISGTDILTSVMVVGHWDFKIYLDFWCATQPDRNRIFSKAHDILNPQIIPQALRLQLPNYFGAWATFDIGGIHYSDSEEAAQRGEWRVTFTILAHCPHLRELAEFAMKTVETTVEIVDTELT